MQRESLAETTHSGQHEKANPLSLRAVGGLALFGIIGVAVFTQPAMATETASEGAHGPGGLHYLLELLQLVVGSIAIVTAALSVQTMRGGHMEWAFYSLTAGILAFLLQRVWHSGHEFGLVGALPGLVEQVLFLLATALIGLGFLIVYRIMRPSA